MEKIIPLEIKKRSVLRLNTTLKTIFIIQVFLLLTIDLYNYLNNIWALLPSPFYTFLNHLISSPLIIFLVVFNNYFLKKFNTKTRHHYNVLLIVNHLVMLPFILMYYYWEMHDFNSSSIFIIFIFIFGMMIRLNSYRLVISTIYFGLIYYGMMYYIGVSYNSNPSLYINGFTALMMLYFMSKSFYRMSYKAIKNEILVNEKNEELIKIKIDLEQKALQLNIQNENLEISNKNLMNFAQVSAHDIKTPLRMISNFTKILSDKYVNEIEKEDLVIQKTIINTCSELTLITDGLLEFSKISNNKIINLSTINLNKLIKDVIILLNDNISKTEPSIVIQDNFPIVYGVRELILQVFLNIINNALKFSSKEQKPSIEISYKLQDEDYLQISIKDNGIGIQKKQTKEIFELFRTLHSNEKFEGNGLGLAISKRIVEKHGGEIWVESEINKGSTFYFTLKTKNTSIKE